MTAFRPLEGLPTEVVELLNETYKVPLKDLLLQVMAGCRTIGSELRRNGYSSATIGTQNAFGDNQLDVDVKTDEVMFNAMKVSKLVHVAASEENPVEIDCGFGGHPNGGEGFSCAFDPLDGSSIIDANMAVGTIMGIWPGNTLMNRYGREQVCALVVQYGPKVTMALAFNSMATITGQPVSLELTMLPESWSLSIPVFTIASQAKTFAPGNLRATADNDAYMALIQYYITHKYTLRYSGGLVPDVYHILIKGQGVLTNASSITAKAKLRLLFEAAPIALIMEAAGGSSAYYPCELDLAAENGGNGKSNGISRVDLVSLLDVHIDDLDRRVGVCYGSEEEVDRFKDMLSS